MQVYRAPLEDMRFQLEVFGYDQVQALEGYEAYDLQTVMEMMETLGSFAANEMLPLNRSGDQEGIHFDAKAATITMPKGFKELYQQFVANGMTSMSHPEEYGGMGAPEMFETLASEMMVATNKSFTMCSGLTNGFMRALKVFGTEEQKQEYLPKMISGEWSGTMCLTEPQCGTDLGLITSKAEPLEDGSYSITGTKIWITFGEHDLTENIVHLVLARLPDAPPGIRGISTFMVPKFIEGERNPVYCGGIEHKLGINASPTCVINLEGAKGWMLGEPHKGMRAMFAMMNHARLGVGYEGVAFSEIAYQTALEFAKERRQGRSLNPARQDANASADVILVHPDVRRLLLNIKSTNEAMRGLGLWVAILQDISHKHADEAERKRCDNLVALLTPIIKSYMTERGFQNVNDAMQAMGGAGYTTDWSVEQYLRDERIAMIYEGTNHVQALDLIGRKLPKNGGEMVMAFQTEVTNLIRESKGVEGMEEFIGHLKEASKTLTNVTMELAAKGMEDQEVAAAVASNYLNVFALTTLAYIWCRQVKVALQREGAFYQTKLKTARYFFHHILPEMDLLVKRIQRGKDEMMAFDDEEFWSAL
jgi:alkylation response protein AidB-like acyl-CoA dehydrogenase